jgi:hypothetical protein
MFGLRKKLYSPRAFDVIFTVVGLACLAFLVLGAGHGAPAIEPSDNPLAKRAILAGIVFAAVIVACLSIRIDQRCADDFLFLTLAKSAMIGMFTLIVTASFWEVLFADSMGALPSLAMLELALAGWASGYFYTRIRGTRA